MGGFKKLNCILLVNEEVKAKLKSNVSNLLVYDVVIINDIRQLNRDMVNKTTRVIIVGDYNYES